MNYELLKEIFIQTGQGNFEFVNNCIASKQLQLTSLDATKIVIASCQSLPDKKSSIRHKQLFHLLQTCTKFIPSIPENRFAHYFQSVYFIVKHFLDMNKYEYVIQMETMLVPHNIKCLKLSAYVSTCALIHNTIFLQSAEMDVRNNFQLLSLLLKMKLLHTAVSDVLEEAVCMYFKRSFFINASPAMQFGCYNDLLKRALKQTPQENDKEDIFKAVVQGLKVVRSISEDCTVEQMNQLITNGILVIVKFGGEDRYFKLIQLLQNSAIYINIKEDTNQLKLLPLNCKKDLKILKELKKSGETNLNLSAICNFLVTLLSKFINFYKSNELRLFERDVHLALSNFLAEVGRNVLMECCKKCSTVTNDVAVIKAVSLIGDLLLANFTKDDSEPKFVSDSVFAYFNTCSDMIIRMKNRGCTAWATSWETISSFIYNISVKLYNLKYRNCCGYLKLLIKTTVILEGTEKPETFQEDLRLTSLLIYLSETYRIRKDFKTASRYAALSILLGPTLEKTYKHWVILKLKLKKHSKIVADFSWLQRLTSVCVLERDRSEILDFCPCLQAKLDDMDVVEILKFELEQFKITWPSKISMARVFKRIYENVPIETSAQIAIKTWANNLEIVDDEVYELLSETCTRYQKQLEDIPVEELRVEEALYLAMSCGLLYYSEIIAARQTLAEDIDSKSSFTSCDPDVCDITPAYIVLNLDQHLRLTYSLRRALFLFDTLVTRSQSIQLVGILQEVSAYEFVTRIAYEFRLHCDSLQETYAWLISLKISRLIGNDLFRLKSISFIIEKASKFCDGFDELISEAEVVANEMHRRTESNDEILESLTIYHINKSKMFWNNLDHEAGLEELMKGKACLAKMRRSEVELLEIHLEFLHTWYLQLPCALQITDHELYLRKFYGVRKNIITFYKETKVVFVTTLVMLFEIIDFIVKTHKWMSLPREVRCFCGDIIVLAQQEVLPLRTAHLLTQFAYADIQTNKLNDCDVKLNGISNILCLDNDNPALLNLPKNDDNRKRKDKTTKSDDKIETEFAEVTLDCPLKRTQAGLTGSPTLRATPFEMAAFTSHREDCDCFHCTSVEYMLLFLTYLDLKAQFHVSLNSLSAANACFKTALRISKQILTKSTGYKAQVTRLLSNYTLDSLRNKLWEVRCTILLNYINNLIRSDDVTKAEILNKKLASVVSPRRHHNMFLYNEVLYQKLVLGTSLLMDNGKPQPIDCVVEDVGSDKLIVKTPECMRTTIVVSPCTDGTKLYSCVKKKADLAACLFPSESEDLTSPEPKIESKPKKFVVTEIACVTPAAVRNRSPTVMKTIKQTRSKSDKENVTVPCSPNAYTPASVKVSQNLRSRTKLLTKRVQKSALKDSNCNEPENDCSDTVKLARKTVCSNLFDKFSAVETKTTKKKKVPVAKKPVERVTRQRTCKK